MSVAISEVKNIFEMNQAELREYNESKLMEFKELFLTTDLPVDEIYKILGLPNKNSNVRYIRNRLKEDGYDTLKRTWSIRKGEWL